MSAANLIARLDAVRQTGPDRWIARCPAHEDRTPSLSVRETNNGTVLLKCWAGCGAADVVAAVGLGLRDLFPPLTGHHHQPIKSRDRWPARDLLALLRREVTVVLLAACAVRDGVALDEADYERLCEVVARITTIADEAACIKWTPSGDDLAGRCA